MLRAEMSKPSWVQMGEARKIVFGRDLALRAGACSALLSIYWRPADGICGETLCEP